MADEWFYNKDGNQTGPVTREELAALLGSGQVAVSTLVWTSGMANWQAASAVPALVTFVIPQPPVGRTDAIAYGGYAQGGESYNGLAIAGFVVSLIPPVAIVGLILSWVALNGMKRTGNPEGKGLATAGLVIGIVFTSIACLYLTCVIGVFATAASQGARGLR